MFRFPRTARVAALAGFAGLAPLCAVATEPGSAIPWLSHSLKTLSVPPPPARPTRSPRKIDTTGVTVAPLDPVLHDGDGLLSGEISGLPKAFWGPTSTLRARKAVLSVAALGVPAAQDLYRTILLARTYPPKGSGPAAQLLRARIDRLIEMGALDEALELLTLADLTSPEFILRRFDVALLTGQEDDACDIVLNTPSVTPTATARIFCLARDDKWAEAVLALAVGRENLDIGPEQDALFARFLDIDDAADDDEIAIPAVVTPLNYLMLQAVGVDVEATSDRSVPVAYYRFDMDPYAPPRARIIAAENLVASGGVSYPLLFYTYRAIYPAASGGLWDRVAAIRDLDTAMQAQDIPGIAKHLARADQLLSRVDLRVALAMEYGPDLARLPVNPALDPWRMAELLLLATEHEAAKQWIDAESPADVRLAADILARRASEPVPTPDLLQAGVRAAFADRPDVSDRYKRFRMLLDQGRLGEVMLGALRILDARTEIDPGDLATALRIIAESGQAGAARRIAVETLLMFED